MTVGCSAPSARRTASRAGTVMEVIPALAGVDGAPPVGILPGGTANVLARSLRIPMRIERAVRALLDGEEAHLDLGRLADGRRFAIGLGVGLDAAMIGAASSGLKRWLGPLAYALTAARAGLRLERFHLRLTVDGRVHELDTSSVLIANFGAGVDNIDLESARARGITVTNTPGVLTDDTADIAFLILHLGIIR